MENDVSVFVFASFASTYFADNDSLLGVFFVNLKFEPVMLCWLIVLFGSSRSFC